MSSKRLFKTPRPALKIIDCEDINKICSLIEGAGSIEDKAADIKNKLIAATLDPEILPALENVDQFIIDGQYNDAAKLSNDIWLIYRRGGIGGSDASSLMGMSKWRTALELYYDKIGEKAPEVIDKGRQYIFDFGHAMEEFVAKHYEKVFMKEYKESVELSFSLQYGEDLRITGCRVYRDTFMYKNPENLFMRADLDFCIDLTFDNGKTAKGVFECKTTSPFQIKEEWEMAPPPYYVCQTRHYMATMDLPFTIIACAADNSANNYYSHIIFRNKKFEKELIAKEKEFWSYVEAKIPPYEMGVNNLNVLLEKTKDIPNNEVRDQSNTIKDIIDRFEECQAALAIQKAAVKELEAKKDVALSDLLTYMVGCDTTNITSEQGELLYTLTVEEKVSNSVDWTKFVKSIVKAHPELADEIDTLKTSCKKNTEPKRSASIKSKKIWKGDK